MTTQQQRSSLSRVWMLPNTAGPATSPVYEGLARAGEPDWSLGDQTPIYIPDPDRYGQFNVVGKVTGERGLPTMDVVFRYLLDAKGALSKYIQGFCDHDVQVHMGICENPQSFDQGWRKILVLEKARPTNWSTSQLGALMPSDDAQVDETVPFSAEMLYEIVRMSFSEQAASQVVQEVIDIQVCDAGSCGECGIPSDGCDIVFALTLTAGGSPGLAAEIIYTKDAGANWDDTNITTLAANQDPNRMACVGTNLVVVSEDSESLHYADIADILDGAETWTEVSTGFVATNGPLAIEAVNQCHVWIVGENGYIYFTADPTSGVSVQDAGSATTQNLVDVSAFDRNNAVAVGDSNAVVVTNNGGSTWQAILGPAVGVNLNAVQMVTPEIIWIGDANGQLWYTEDGGANWVEKLFPNSGSGVVRDLKFITPSVGYMAFDLSTGPSGRIYRTVNGGFSWYVLPEGNLSLPANDRINAIAPCSPRDPNTVYGGGLADDATDGIIVKGAGATI